MTENCTTQAHAPAPPGTGPCPTCEHPRCNGTTKTGRCRKQPIKGATVCRTHGGSAPQVRAAAERAQREAEASAILARVVWNPDAAPITDPFSEMQLLAGQMRQATDRLGAMLGPSDPCEFCGRGPVALDSAEGIAWLRQQRELRQLLESMGRLGIMSRGVEVQQGQAELMLGWLRAGFEAGTAVGATRVQLDAVMGGFLDAMRRSRAGAVVAELEAGIDITGYLA